MIQPAHSAEYVAPLRAFSYGGGVQSTAALVLAAQGRIDFPVFLFANVGDDSEHPDTLAYINQIAKPYAADHGIKLHELRRISRTRPEETLWQQLHRENTPSIPVHFTQANGDPGGIANRSCTKHYKIVVINRWLREAGATKEQPAALGIGISVDEIERANTKNPDPYRTVAYPLLELGLRRSDCMQVIRNAGLPVPRKSACFFCPFTRPQDWQDMQRERPDLFDKAVALERVMNARRESRGKPAVWLSRFNRPLDEAWQGIQGTLDLDPGACDSGFCFT